MSKQQKGSGIVEALLAVAVIAFIGFVGWRLFAVADDSMEVSSAANLQNSSPEPEEEVTQSAPEEIKAVGDNDNIEVSHPNPNPLPQDDSEDTADVHENEEPPVETPEPETSLTGWQKDHCEFIEPRDGVFRHKGFAVMVASSDSNLLSCEIIGGQNYIYTDKSVSISTVLAEDRSLLRYSGGPTFGVWTARLDKLQAGYSVQVVDNERAATHDCGHGMINQLCDDGEQYSLEISNLAPEHPSYEIIIINVFDEGMRESPQYDLYEVLLNSIELPL